jgi:putative restriction endonuclease
MKKTLSPLANWFQGGGPHGITLGTDVVQALGFSSSEKGDREVRLIAGEESVGTGTINVVNSGRLSRVKRLFSSLKITSQEMHPLVVSAERDDEGPRLVFNRAPLPHAPDGSEQGVNQEQRAAAVWTVLADCAGKEAPITYGDLAEKVGFHHRTLRYPLGLIQDHCLSEKLPPLTSLVVRGGDSLPGSGFIAWDVDDLQAAQKRVFAFDWTGLPNPFGYASGGETAEGLAERLVGVPASAGEIYQLVKVRGKAQMIFREALLRAYDYACAFCGLTFKQALDAAHVVPWAECSGEDRMSVNNGILLCSNHYELFDSRMPGSGHEPRYWLQIGEDFKIQYADMDRKHGPYSSMDEAVSVKLHGKPMTLPKDKKLWPNPEKIRKRYQS